MRGRRGGERKHTSNPLPQPYQLPNTNLTPHHPPINRPSLLILHRFDNYARQILHRRTRNLISLAPINYQHPLLVQIKRRREHGNMLRGLVRRSQVIREQTRLKETVFERCSEGIEVGARVAFVRVPRHIVEGGTGKIMSVSEGDESGARRRYEPHSLGAKRLTPARMHASMMFFCVVKAAS
jgi:hypothetical protein